MNGNGMRLRDYQLSGVHFALDRFCAGERGAGFLFDPGMGKTLTSLQTVLALRDLLGSCKTLVIAPLRPVYSVWPREIEKWGVDLSYSILHGSGREKRLVGDSDLYLINSSMQSLRWLGQQPRRPNFDLLIVDESTEFKNWTSARMKMLRYALPHFKRRLILTGTPIPNSYADLFAQIFILDDGETLGKNRNVFRARYCQKGGFKGREWLFRSEFSEHINANIRPLVYRLDEADHLELPPIVFNDVRVELPPVVRKQYDQVEQQLFVDLDNGDSITAETAAMKYAMVRGIANGGFYENADAWKLDKEGKMRETRVRVATYHLHEAKTQAARELVDSLQGKPVVVCFQFDHDYQRLSREFKRAPVIRGGVSAKQSDEILSDWNAGKIPVLLVQPETIRYGVNMQSAGNDLIWYGIPDKPLTYQQMNKRLHRQGVEGTVRIHHLIASRTVDEAAMMRQRDKGVRQRSLLDALRKYQQQK